MCFSKLSNVDSLKIAQAKYVFSYVIENSEDNHSLNKLDDLRLV
jgi:hypothetical protein